MARRKRSPFATDEAGTDLWVLLSQSGIHPMVAMCDGLSLTFFGKEKAAYVRVEAAADWHERELKESRGKSGSAAFRDGLRRALADFRAGRLPVDDAP